MEYDIVEFEQAKIVCYFKKGTYSDSFENIVKDYKDQGELHRLDGPAYIYKTDKLCNEYYQNGKLHRLDGPARHKSVIVSAISPLYKIGYKRNHRVPEWWVNGVLLSEEKVRIIKLWLDNKSA